METLRIKVQVKDLRVGDDLGGTVLTANPEYLGNYLGQKDRMTVNVRYANGQESTRIWGKYTTVPVINR